MKSAGGFTIIQTMILLLVLGIVGWAVTNVVIDMQCKEDTTKSICANRSEVWKALTGK